MEQSTNETVCVICQGYLQFQESSTVNEDGVCATCEGMMSEENDSE